MEKDKGIIGGKLSGYTHRLYNFRDSIIRHLQRNKQLPTMQGGQGLRADARKPKTREDTLRQGG